MNPARLAFVGLAIIFVGFVVVALGTFAGQSGSGSSAGFILIGPIPIVFGSGPNSGVLAVAAMVITVAMVALYLLSFFLRRSGRKSEAEIQAE